MVSLDNPHDRYFKNTMGDPANARNFASNYFPRRLKTKINLNKIIPVKNEAVNELLAENKSDLLYKIKLINKQRYIYFLFEHKSYLSYKISLQLLKYLVSIWEILWQQKNKQEKLPVILPIVFYHGEKKWNISLNLSTLLRKFPGQIKPFIPDYEYILYDFSAKGDREIKGNLNLKLFLNLLRYAQREDFIHHLEDCLQLIKQLDQTDRGMECLRTAIKYILNVNESIEYNDLKKKSKKIIPERSEEIITLAEKLKQKGKLEGKKEGIETLIYKLLCKKFNDLPDNFKHRLEKLDTQTLETIGEKMLEIDTLEELEPYFKQNN